MSEGKRQTWADRAAPIIAEVIREVGRAEIKNLRKSLMAAYPFDQRKGYPYRAWLKEVHRQLGHPLYRPRVDPENKQMDMFDRRDS